MPSPYQRRPEADTDQILIQKKRTCLRCRQPFTSSWSGERICRRCKRGDRYVERSTSPDDDPLPVAQP